MALKHYRSGIKRCPRLKVMMVVILLSTTILSALPSVALDYGQGTKLPPADASIIGEDDNDRLGEYSTFVGDVNGDGYADLLLGAPGNDRGGTDSGQTYLFFGPSTSWTMNMVASSADASFVGLSANDLSGTKIAGVGDVNGDGMDDFIIGAPQYWNSPSQTTSRAYLFFGKASGWTIYQSLNNANVIFSCAINRQGYAEVNVDGGGDFNNDGFDDIIIGCPHEEITSDRGHVYVIFGKESGWTKQQDLLDYPISYRDHNVSYTLGSTVASIGDVNGDIYDDFAIGNYMTSWATIIVYGRSGNWSKDMAIKGAGTRILLEDAEDSTIDSMAPAGDVNGDGFGDLLLGSPYSDEIDFFSGEVFLLFGRLGGWGAEFNLSQANASFIGLQPMQNLGYAVSSAGDVDGDGFDDFLIGDLSPAWGKSYLFLGRPQGWSLNMNMSKANASFGGKVNIQDVGCSLSGGADLDQDGLDDIILGDWVGEPYTGNGEAFIIYPDHNLGPSSITSLKAYTDASYSIEKTSAKIGDTVFLESQGPGGNASKVDVTMVSVESTSDHPGFNVRLTETGFDTGVYRGNVRVMDRTNEDRRWIGADPGNDVTLTSLKDPTKKVVLPVIGVRLRPKLDLTTILEDAQYLTNYSAIGNTVTQWTFSSNGSWLDWDATSHKLSGTPDNGDVGTIWAKLNITDGAGNYDEHNFTVRVINVPPKITTNNVVQVPEDKAFSIDYNSTDDGQGNVSWALDSNATWLHLDPLTGVLNGTPDDAQIGKWRVNVSVSDGNGGAAWTYFILTVTNINERPRILGEDILFATEDSFYSQQYSSEDPDKEDELTWALHTNTSSWLHLDAYSGLLSGIPTNDDVGSYWVNISVSDLALTSDHHNFTLRVNNTNDPPVILTHDRLTANEDSLYQVDYKVEDVDKNELCTWSMSTNASSWLKMNLTTAVLEGTPGNGDVGQYWVKVSVKDLAGAEDHHNFTLTVLNVNDPPTILSVPPTRINMSQQYSYQVVAEDIDVGDSLNYSLLKKPNGMVIEATGMIKWTPTKDQVGVHPVQIKVYDGKAYVTQSFNVTVVPPNHSPSIDPLKSITVRVGNKMVQAVVAHDEDTGDTLTYTLDSNLTGMTISSTGLIEWKPSKGQEGVHTVRVTVSDGKAKVSSEFKVIVTKRSSTSSSSPLWIIILIIVIIIACVVAVILVLWKKGKGKDATTVPSQ